MNPSTYSQQNQSSFLSCFTKCFTSRKQPTTFAEINRKKWKELGYKNEKQTLPPIFTILIDLYDGRDVYKALEDCRINPDYTTGHYIRNDLDYYIPQFTNFMILHEDFGNGRLKIFLDELSKTDIYFAHVYSWYISSLAPNIGSVNKEKAQITVACLVDTCSTSLQNQLFLDEYTKFYSALEQRLTKEEFEAKKKEIEIHKVKVHQALQEFKSKELPSISLESPLKASDLDIRPYISPFIHRTESYQSNPFTSTLLFF